VQFRDGYPAKDPAFAKFNHVTWRDPDGQMQTRREPLPQMPDELKQIIEELG
jgi:hypothetical protein